MDKALEVLGLNNIQDYKSVNYHGPLYPVKNEPVGAIKAYKTADMPTSKTTGDGAHSSWQGKESYTAWPSNDPGNMPRGEVKRQRDKFE